MTDTITIPRALLEQALKALGVATTPLAEDRQEVLEAVAALRSALEQPQRTAADAGYTDIVSDGGMDPRNALEQPQQEPVKPPGMAVQALAGEIIEALLADEKDGGYDLTAGLFGANFSELVRRWAAAEWNALKQPQRETK